jgi:hypothetical protein
MNAECEKCGSTDFTKLSLIYEQGFSELKTRSRGWGAGFGIEGAALGFGRAKTAGHFQSKLSRAVSPPGKMSYWKVIKWGLLVSLIVWWVLFNLTAAPGGPRLLAPDFPFIACANGGLLVFLLWVVWRYNRLVFPGRYANWDSSFMCTRCGHIVQLNPRIEHSPEAQQEVRP